MAEREQVWSIQNGAALLRCTHCSACGKDLFPPQQYGCTSCGAFGESLEETGLPAEGTLISFAVVYTHDKHPVPFTLGDVELRPGGPVVRVELSASTEPKLGARLRASVVDDDDGQRLEFVAVSEVRA